MRTPPRWQPENEATYPFETYCQDIILWSMVTDLQPYQQCAAIIQQLGGQARELARQMRPQELLHGGVINGVQVDPVTLLFHGLSARFAQLGEETRMSAFVGIMNFRRRPNERINELLTRFETTVMRAKTHANWNMN